MFRRPTLLLSAFSTTAFAQTDPRPILLGESRTVRSEILNENRELQISLPDNYRYTTIRYPVLYVLDGSSNFLQATATTRVLNTARNRIPEMLVVAIPNTNRNRDLSPGSGAATFQRVLGDEIIPWVERNYRAAPERVVLGHSRGGMFVVHALLHRPDLFDGYIALSVPLYRYDGLAQQVAVGLERAGAVGHSLYLAVGDEESQDMRDGMRRFADTLREIAPPDLQWSFTVLPDEHHNSTLHEGLYEALEARYRDYRFPFFETIAELDSLGGVTAIERHYRSFSTRFGYETLPPEGRVLQAGRLLLEAQREADVRKLVDTYLAPYPVTSEVLTDQLGQSQLQQRRFTDAIGTFRMNTERFPASPNAHRSLGDAYCRSGNEAVAERSFNEAVRVARAVNHPRVAQFEARVTRGCAPR